MIAYLDASVIVPSLIAEPASPGVKRWLAAAGSNLAMSDLAYGELISALHRAVRNGRAQLSDVTARLETFDRWRDGTCSAVIFTAADMRNAADHVRRFDLALRMPDALHLIVCARLGLALATFDRRLFRAAVALGVAAVRPS